MGRQRSALLFTGKESSVLYFELEHCTVMMLLVVAVNLGLAF